MSSKVSKEAEQRQFIAAIDDDPTDIDRRIDFADWLQKHRQRERGSWVRHSCFVSDIQRHLEECMPDAESYRFILPRDWRYSHFKYGLKYGEETLVQLFELCKPEYWTQIAGVLALQYFGRLLFTVTNRPKQDLAKVNWNGPTRRLGQTPWLHQAFQDGWLELIDFSLYDAKHAATLLEWPESSLELPLFIRTSRALAEGFNSRLVEGLISMPGLRGLEMTVDELAFPCIDKLPEVAPGIQYLNLEYLRKNAASQRILELLPDLSRLRVVWINGWFPYEDQIKKLASHSSLRMLAISSDCVTDRWLSAFHATKSLRTLIVDSNEITRSGIRSLRAANPRLRVLVGNGTQLRLGPI